MDYIHLQQLLAQEKWSDADEVTAEILLQLVGRHHHKWLRVEDIYNLPCHELYALDQLWLNYSEGHFGFSPQFHLYVALHYEIMVDSEDSVQPIWQDFSDRVGWRKNHQWLLPTQLQYDLTAPRGHLPWHIGLTPLIQVLLTGEGLTAFFARLKVCGF